MWITKVAVYQRRWAWAAWVAIALAAVQVAWWATDREPPYKMLAYTVEPVRVGGFARMVLEVKRDTRRQCSVNMTRWIADARGFRAYIAPIAFSASDIDTLEKIAPGRVNVVIELPEWISTGTAHYESVIAYTCNPLHKFWPILYRQSVEFVVNEK